MITQSRLDLWMGRLISLSTRDTVLPIHRRNVATFIPLGHIAVLLYLRSFHIFIARTSGHVALTGPLADSPVEPGIVKRFHGSAVQSVCCAEEEEEKEEEEEENYITHI